MGGASRLLPTRFRHTSSTLRLSRRPCIPLPALPLAASFHQYHHFLPSLPGPVRLSFFCFSSMQFHTNSASAWESHGDAMTSAHPDRATAVHPWPEWSKLVSFLASGGYYDKQGSAPVGFDDDDSFSAKEDLTEEFMRTAQACLSFARDGPNLLRMLSKNDIKIIVENCSPFLFKNGANSVRRLKAFLSAARTNVLESESAQTVDIMRYLLSNVYISTSNHTQNFRSSNLIDTSTRSLFAELMSLNNASSYTNSADLTPQQNSINHGQFSRQVGQNIEMKRGDWICQKCSFMNFARNVKCLKCGDARPKRAVTGGEWECPQCSFFNYSRNMLCLRCNCKRPGENPISTAPSDAFSRSLDVGQILNGSGLDKSEIEKKLAANDEKAERWFSKISQLDDSADLSSAIDNEDFPEIMPMRKGVNRFVVSTRKTPLERRLANAQSKSNLDSSNCSEAKEFQPGKTSEISQMLDRILGCSSTSSGMNHPVNNGGNNSEAGNLFSSSESREGIVNGKTNSDHVPLLRLPADTLGKPTNAGNDHSPNFEDSASSEASQLSDSVLKDYERTIESKNTNSFDDSKRWSEEVIDHDSVKDLTKALSDDDLPEIMPMRRGENRFVVSNKKDRTITSPQYKRRIAMEQANSSNFVPFVPFPPDYFAKKEDKQTEVSATGSFASERDQSFGVNATDPTANWSANQNTSETSNTSSRATHLDKHQMRTFSNGASNNSPQLSRNMECNQSQTWSNIPSQNNTYSGPSVPANSHQTDNTESAGEGWKPRFSGKSLEGSAVTEPDPLDMSEEAKAARWFRRAAQIKDISELSNIPDEDFPEIMPMRKGVNRFVVSKRKTPLERRLTSSQYRRNLPIISSDPEKDSN